MSGGWLRATLLGTGSSGGVPRIGEEWGACDPLEPRNRRSRCSLLLQLWRGEPRAAAQATTVLIDTSPDFRAQALAVGLKHVDAVLYSHDHADQSHGIDDLRILSMSSGKRVLVWMDEATRATLRQRFGYCFTGGRGYLPALEEAGVLTPGTPVEISGPGGPLLVTPLDQDHGPIRSLGFRIGDLAYSNDMRDLPEATLARLHGLAIWIADALRYKPHPTHAHLAQVLLWREHLAPARTVLTNLHVDMDYQRLLQELPARVEPGYDGLALELPYDFP